MTQMTTASVALTCAIYIFFLTGQHVHAQWSSSARVQGTTEIVRLDQIGDSFGDFFALCHPTSTPSQRHLCRVMNVRCCQEGNSSFAMDSILLASVSNFAVADGFHLTGGLNTIELRSGKPKSIQCLYHPSYTIFIIGRLTSSFGISPGPFRDMFESNAGTTFSPRFGVVVASAIDLVTDGDTTVPVQYHFAYDVVNNVQLQWSVHRIVANRTENNAAWPVERFFLNCAAGIDPALILNTIRTINGSKVWSIAFPGLPNFACSGIFQFDLPSTFAANNFSIRPRDGINRRVHSPMAISGDLLFHTNGGLCRFNLTDLRNECSQLDRLRIVQMAASEDKLYVAFSHLRIQVYGFDLQTQSLSLPLNVTPDALIVRNNYIFMAYREVNNGMLTPMIRAAPLDRFLTEDELWALNRFEPPMFYFHPYYIVALIVVICVVGAFAIVGWVLYGVLRKKTQSWVKSDSYVMLNEQLNK